MPTGDAGSPIGGRSSETQEGAVTGPWTVRPLHGPPRDAGGADEEGERGARFNSQSAAQSTAKTTTSCSAAQRRVDPAFSLLHPTCVKLF